MPSWSPDGKQLAFASDRLPGNRPTRSGQLAGSTGFNVFIANANGTGIFQLTNKPDGTCDADPDWSPDGKQVAYTSCETGPKKIFTIHLTWMSGLQCEPDWKP